MVSSDVPTAPHGRARYARYWGTEFWELVDDGLQGATAVLDVGGGRRPTILPQDRPGGIHYAGLDVSAGELALAQPGSYDETVSALAERRVSELVGRFDLIVSWQVFEHISDLPRAVDNFKDYLRPGGTLVASLSGRHAAFAVANRILPTELAQRFVAWLRRREPDTVFPAFYDHCDCRGLRRVFERWDKVEVIPLWRGADYFESLGPLLHLYLRYEDLAIARGWHRLATHYVVSAHKAEESR